VSLDHRLQGPEGAPVIVLSNSLGTTQELWSLQLPELVDRFRVLTYDHPGHGASELPESPCTV
jgi:3-oxoadipate enol-lactonase